MHGINPDESLEIILSYSTAADFVDALINDHLRIGLHVQGFAGGYSESFLHTYTGEDSVPEPGTMTLLLAGLFVLRQVRRIR